MLGLGLMQFLPAQLRRPAIDAASQMRVGYQVVASSMLGGALRIKREPRAFCGQRVAVAGLLSSPSGLGRGARLMIADLKARGVEVLPIDLASRFHHAPEQPYPGALTPRQAAAHGPTDLLIHLNPPEFLTALRMFPPQALWQTTIIGHWTWELDRAPRFWAHCAKVCDEIWVPSEFVADALRRSGCSPESSIQIVPYPVDRDPFPSRSWYRGRAARVALGIPLDGFVAGAAWSMMSGFERKGARSAIAAFQSAFPGRDKRHMLLLRCPDAEVYAPGWQMIRAAAARDPRIALLDSTQTQVSMADFYNVLDVYLSLTRGEGYGLTIAEASQAGLPVLATGWGLAPDLAARRGVVSVGYSLCAIADPQHRYDGVDGAFWAEPDTDEAALRLRELAARHSLQTGDALADGLTCR